MRCERSWRRTGSVRPRAGAYGLLGYHHGRRVLAEAFGRECGPHPEWLLVQHLGTPDLVLNQLFGSFSRENLPAYERDPATGALVQDREPAFPRTTFDLEEVIDSTFYSHAPATAPTVRAIMERHGGAGIVVSLQECLSRYARLRTLVEASGPQLPADPRQLREWSLVMVLTGVLEAIERNLLPPGSEVIVHGSGSYAASDYTPLSKELTVPVSSADDAPREP